MNAPQGAETILVNALRENVFYLIFIFFYFFIFLSFWVNLILILFHILWGIFIQRAHTDFINRSCEVQLYLALKASTVLRSTGARFRQLM